MHFCCTTYQQLVTFSSLTISVSRQFYFSYVVHTVHAIQTWGESQQSESVRFDECTGTIAEDHCKLHVMAKA